MSIALYAPGLGYYVAGARKFGTDGDFVTAPELTSLFGGALATQVADVLAHVPGDVIELGPGSGRLAADMLDALAARDALPARYRLLEVSPDLRDRQRAHLQRECRRCSPRVEWIDVLPERWRGVLVANEVLDAVPPHVVVRADSAWHERGVALDGGRLCCADRPLARRRVARRPRAHSSRRDGDYASEINPAAQALVSSLAQRCEAGALLFVDYGFPAAEYYHPQRSGGTVMAHYRHPRFADPLFLPGLADLTAHVDFSAVARSGVAAGMARGGLHLAGALPDQLRHPRSARADGRSVVDALSARSSGGAETALARGDGRVVQGAGADARHRRCPARISRRRPGHRL